MVQFYLKLQILTLPAQKMINGHEKKIWRSFSICHQVLMIVLIASQASIKLFSSFVVLTCFEDLMLARTALVSVQDCNLIRMISLVSNCKISQGSIWRPIIIRQIVSWVFLMNFLNEVNWLDIIEHFLLAKTNRPQRV